MDGPSKWVTSSSQYADGQDTEWAGDVPGSFFGHHLIDTSVQIEISHQLLPVTRQTTSYSPSLSPSSPSDSTSPPMVSPKLMIPLTVTSALFCTAGALYYRDHHWAPFLNGPQKLRMSMPPTHS